LSDEDSILSAGAVALSASATVAGLVITLRNKGILSDDDERQLYELALTMLNADQGDDESGVFDTARVLIEEHLRPAG
jgi:DNA-binding IclR family transcriptional regulator